MTETEKMDAFTAVFNGHINNAHRRARDAMGRECPGYLAKVLKREKDGNGIMAIFHPPYSKSGKPFRAFTRYAELVRLFVNYGDGQEVKREET